MRKQKIVIIGAGIVGASIAYQLAKQNQEVTVIERHPASALEVTEKSFAWIHTTHSVAPEYWHLYDAAVEEYHVLQQELPELFIQWHGALTWGDPALREPHRLQKLNRQQIEEMEPNLQDYPNEAIFASEEGAVDPIALTELLLSKAQEYGAKVQFDTNVTQLQQEDSRLVGVHTSKGFVESDIVVLAAGMGVPRLCNPLGFPVPVEPSPSILIRMKTANKLIRTLISNAQFEARQPTEHTLLAAEDYIDESEENGPATVGKRAFETLRRSLKGGNQLELESIKVGLRPMPEDGYPIVGFHDHMKGLYLAVMHSAITLSPLIARLAASEMIHRDLRNELDPCRLSRFKDY
ncbi:NAD(P)/FAD-dependent oxidoreductase [Paenibacillus radicis (ex Gao et al. 2016)]|uniref:D-amino-acid oxidase n=1 Tax=Paenibacillus radicis (ex Gao et al. 2016) TaxID=1737354 RepID=A0A917GX01_9BACL|nr:FAD-dependent oxidoreductase [Paenibacillus radicis (ex Gao et al. 2016)]GGG59400.1 D-amino-acid oxidase [Paenibacillus radicis (ex Gao et al. 2016)]